MTEQWDSSHSASRYLGQIAVRRIGLDDLRVALARGWDDFNARPTHYAFLGLIYPILMIVVLRLTLDQGLLQLAYPFVAGCALLGSFVAVGLYEMSRRREQGLEVSWRNAFDVLRSPALKSILSLGVVMVAWFALWLWIAMGIYVDSMGPGAPASMGAFAERLFTTAEGWRLIAVGNVVGALFAVVGLALSVVSFPLLIDRHVGVMSAVATSVAAVVANPVPMIVWGLIVAGMLLLGAIPLLVGLAVVIPVLGHATWHLYRRVVTT